MNARHFITGLILVAILAGAGYFAFQQFLAPQSEEDAVTTELSASAVAPVAGMISVEGTIVPLHHATLSFQVTGEVAEILVEKGAAIKRGEPLLRLDTTNSELAVTQAEVSAAQAQADLATAAARLTAVESGLTAAEIGVAAAQARLALATAAPLPEAIAVSQSQVASANAIVYQADAGRDVTLGAATAAEIEAAQAQLAAAVAASRPVQEAYDQMVRADEDGDAVEIAQIRLNAAQANVNAAQAALNELHAGASEAQRRAANAGVAAAVARRDAAQAQLDLLQAGASSEQIRVAEVGVAQAEAAMAEATLAVDQAKAAVAQAEAGLEQATRVRESAQVALERMTLRAPFAGRVSDLSVELGELVSPGMPLITVADFSGWLVKTTNLTELDVVSVQVGSPVSISVDAFPGQVLSGTVREIAPVFTLTHGDVTYEVTITLDEPELPLRWGMTTFVEISEALLSEAETGIASPVTANPGTDLVSAEGTVIPVRHAGLSFGVNGQAAEILVRQGTAVQAGDPLLRLEAADLESKVKEAEASLAQTEAGLEAARTRLALAEAGVNTAESDVTAAEAQLALVKADPLAQQVAATQLQIDAAAAGVAQAAANRDVMLSVPASHIRAAEADVAAAMANKEALQRDYDQIIDTCFETAEGEVCPLYGTVEEQTRFRLHAAQAQLEAAQAALDELSQGATEAEQRAANATVTVAATEREAAEARLNLLLVGAREEQIAQAEIAVEQAETAVVQAEAAVTGAEAAVARAEAQVTQAEANLAAAQADLARMTLKAPFAGTVGRVAVERGEVITAGTPVITLADMSGWLVETTDLTELDVVAVAAGDAGHIRLEALPNAVVPGTVAEIAAASTLRRGDVTYNVTIHLDEAAASQLPLRWGMSALVDVAVEAKAP